MVRVLKGLILILISTTFIPIQAKAATGASAADNEFLDMDLSELMQITITSVSKKPEPITDAASAIFVITAEDIERIGATSIPEVLRLAPGLQVSQFGSNKWTIAARGFSAHFSNKLLVLIDGRSIYTPAFSGVYWDVQNTLLEDIKRIEVIRGPGATLWGSNAMNGVINIITKSAADTQGGLVKLGVGNKERFQGGLRYGGEISQTTKGRSYLIYNNRDSYDLYSDNRSANDDWEVLQGGFRLDGNPSNKTTWTFQGDIYNNDENQLVSPYWLPTFPFVTEERDNFTAKGWNLLGRYQRRFSKTQAFTLQTYYDVTQRDELYVGQKHHTLDLEAQYQTLWGKSHALTTGLGYRNISADFDPTFQVMAKENHSDNIYSGFIQDAITLIPDRLTLTLGTKWEHNDYTGHEFQPSGRLMWKPAPKHAFWSAISRAVRTPSQIEDSGEIIYRITPTLPPNLAISRFIADGRFDSEEMIAYEAGYRWFPRNNLSFDLALFYNDYDTLLSAERDNPLSPNNLYFDNKASAKGHGAELTVDWQATDKIDLLFSYTYLNINADIDGDSTSNDILLNYEGSFPKHQLSLNANVDFLEKWSGNLWLRYVDKIESASTAAEAMGIEIDDYFDCDLGLTYRAKENLTFKLVGQNLFQSGRLEFVSEFPSPPTEVERGFYATITFTFN